MMEKSLTSFRSCRAADREAFTRAGRGPSPKQPWCGEPSVHPKNTAGPAPAGQLGATYPCGKVAAALEVFECRTAEEGAPEEQEGQEGDIGHVVAAGPQELPSSAQALRPAQPGGGCGRLWGCGEGAGGKGPGMRAPRARGPGWAALHPPQGEGSVPHAGLWAKGALCRWHSLPRRGLRESGGSQCPRGWAWSSQAPAPVASPGGSELLWLPRQGFWDPWGLEMSLGSRGRG